MSNGRPYGVGGGVGWRDSANLGPRSGTLYASEPSPPSDPTLRTPDPRPLALLRLARIVPDVECTTMVRFSVVSLLVLRDVSGTSIA